MAYKGYKGCGPKGLGSSPLKQDIDPTQLRLAEIKQTRDRMNKKVEPIETRKKESMVRNIDPSLYKPKQMGMEGLFNLLGGAGKGAVNVASKLFGKSKNQKALDAFLKASPKDPTKTTRLSHYNKATPKAKATGPTQKNGSLFQEGFKP
jgi:hypothetical protein|tara:strand:- start:130 stop:576 length:447 start_codon:yes stop_codon:yes gene_type:complete